MYCYIEFKLSCSKKYNEFRILLRTIEKTKHVNKLINIMGSWDELGAGNEWQIQRTNNEYKIELRGLNCMHFAIGHNLLLHWIQTNLSWKPEIVFN